MKIRFFILALTVPLVTGMTAVGQDPSSAVQETAEVVLVEVPVRVTGRDGAPIRDLTAADFQLYDDGKKQEILGFDAIDLAEKGRAIPEQELNPAARRRFLLLFDFSFSRPKALLEARGAAKEFVLSGMGDRDFGAVATFSLETGLRLILNFSSDRVQLARAIDTLGLATSLAKEKDPFAKEKDPLEFVYDTTMLQRMSVAGTDAPARLAGAQAAALIEALGTLKALGRATQDRYARGRLGQLFSSFDDLAAALDLVGGRKDIIYLSEGFESRLLVGTPETEQEKQWIIQGETWKIDSDRRFGNSALQSQLENMTALFRRSDCVIHAVDLSGIRTDADVTSLEPTRADSNSLFEFAQGTGGEVLRNANNFRTDLADLIRRTNLVYVLAFRPTRTGGEGKFHALKVKVHASGARVSARAGYYERKTFKLLSPLERGLLAADVIANEVPVSQIPARLLASPLPDGQGPARVPVLIEAPGPELLTGQNGPKLAVEIYVYAYDAEGRVRDFFTQGVSIDLGINRERLEKGGLKYYGQLTLSPGQYRLRALVRNGETGRMGLAVDTVLVPNFSEKAPYLASPVFLETSSEGIFLRGRLGVAGAGGQVEQVMLPVSHEGLVPTALPEVHAGTPARVSVVAYNFGEAKEQSLKIDAQVLSDEGKPLREGAIRVLEQSPADPDGKRVLLIAFTPEDLSPGRYSLRVLLQDSTSGKAGSSSSPFLVR